MRITHGKYILEKLDDLNWQAREVKVLGKNAKPENIGKEKEIPLGYYASAEHAVLDLARTIADSDPDAALDFAGYAKRLAEVGQEIVESVRRVMK